MLATLRRFVMLFSLFGLCACVSIPAPESDTRTARAQALFDATADAHGRAAFGSLQDIAVAYDGQWYALVQKLQGVLVDPDYRQRSEERLLIGEGVIGQVHTGPAGRKVVLRERRWRPEAASASLDDGSSRVKVRYDGQPDRTGAVLDAAALVADAYRMFLLGPLHFIGSDAQMETLSAVRLDGRPVDRLRIRTRPGLGASAQDDYVLYIDRDERLTRRIRFTLEGLASTRGAIVETDLFDYMERDGLRLPTRFFERIRRPIPGLRAHRWRMTGLDLNRGMTAEEVSPQGFTGSAQRPAEALGR